MGTSPHVRRVGIVLLMVAVAWTLWTFLKPSPLKVGAEAIVNALRSGDGNALFRACHSTEIECSELTPSKLHKAWELLIKPHLDSSTFVRAGETLSSDSPTQATTALIYRDRNGRQWNLLAIANQSNEGIRASVLDHMLATDAMFDDQGNLMEHISTQQQLDHHRRIRALLEPIGIARIAMNPRRCATWDELLKVFEDSIAYENSDEYKRTKDQPLTKQ